MEVWECVVLAILCAGLIFCLLPFAIYALAIWWGAVKEAFEEFNQ